jgi:hypothetical protein
MSYGGSNAQLIGRWRVVKLPAGQGAKFVFFSDNTFTTNSTMFTSGTWNILNDGRIKITGGNVGIGSIIENKLIIDVSGTKIILEKYK